LRHFRVIKRGRHLGWVETHCLFELFLDQGGSAALRRNGAARAALRLEAPLARPRRELAHLSILMQSGTNGTAGLYGAVFLGKNCPTLPWCVNAASGVAPRSLREH
jgi:hypothetical protein